MFKYMGDYYLEPQQSVEDKFLKVEEEYKEIKMGICFSKGNSHIAQELLDTILACKNMLRKMQDEELIDIGTETFKHSVKLNQYLETGKYKK
ncbi:MAG: hypothetical protein RSB50_06985 [Cetobacterium sp.]